MADLYVLTEQALAGMEVELIDVERAAMGLLRVTIDREGGVRIEDCEHVTRQLSRVYEVENIDYKRLEVGSPGVDRPLRRQADFLRVLGERVELKLREALDGRKVFTGILHQMEDDEAGQPLPAESVIFGLELEASKKGEEPQVLRFEFVDVERAKLDPILNFKGKKR